MFSGIDKTGATGPLGPKRVEQARPAETDKPYQEQQEAIRSAASDSARISASSAEIARYQEMAALHREAYGPADRSAKLDEVRKRVQEGYYDQPEVIDKLAGQVAHAARESGEESDVDRAKRRSDDGFYDQPDVIDQTADNLLRQILPGMGRGRG